MVQFGKSLETEKVGDRHFCKNDRWLLTLQAGRTYEGTPAMELVQVRLLLCLAIALHGDDRGIERGKEERII